MDNVRYRSTMTSVHIAICMKRASVCRVIPSCWCWCDADVAPLPLTLPLSLLLPLPLFVYLKLACVGSCLRSWLRREFLCDNSNFSSTSSTLPPSTSLPASTSPSPVLRRSYLGETIIYRTLLLAARAMEVRIVMYMYKTEGWCGVFLRRYLLSRILLVLWPCHMFHLQVLRCCCCFCFFFLC